MKGPDGDRLKQTGTVVGLVCDEVDGSGPVRKVHDDHAADRCRAIVRHQRSTEVHRIEVATNKLSMSVGDIRPQISGIRPIDHMNHKQHDCSLSRQASASEIQ